MSYNPFVPALYMAQKNQFFCELIITFSGPRELLFGSDDIAKVQF